MQKTVLGFVRELVQFMFNVRPIPLGTIPEIEPVFIVGAARSGTTPLQLALNMHPELGVYDTRRLLEEARPLCEA